MFFVDDGSVENIESDSESVKSEEVCPLVSSSDSEPGVVAAGPNIVPDDDSSSESDSDRIDDDAVQRGAATVMYDTMTELLEAAVRSSSEHACLPQVVAVASQSAQGQLLASLEPARHAA